MVCPPRSGSSASFKRRANILVSKLLAIHPHRLYARQSKVFAVGGANSRNRRLEPEAARFDGLPRTLGFPRIESAARSFLLQGTLHAGSRRLSSSSHRGLHGTGRALGS